MITKINTSDYNHVKIITLNGVEFSSSYNHNYFYNKNNGDLILEETDDDQNCYYYRLEKKEDKFVSNYLGFTQDQYGFGIFDMDYEGFPYRSEHNIVELNDELS